MYCIEQERRKASRFLNKIIINTNLHPDYNIISQLPCHLFLLCSLLSILYLYLFLYYYFCLILSRYFLISQFLLILYICFLYSLYPCLFSLSSSVSLVVFTFLSLIGSHLILKLIFSVHLSLSMFYSDLTCHSLYYLLQYHTF